ncbi:MAG: hypothetical protein IKG39_08840 [Lachnospiraceae bacterium]|nr:hypothetical protein [Lachnospiraceae bacterium]
MGRCINADSLLDYLRNLDRYEHISLKAIRQIIDAEPTADVQAFFTEDEIALINQYKDLVEAVDFKTAILNAVSVALDKVYWQNVFSNKPTDSAPTADVLEVMASAWIPVSERLPEKYGWYLCTLKDDRVNELYYSNGIWLDNAKKHLFDLYDIRSRFTGEIVEPEQESVYWTDWVTAWMPKPESFKP